MTQEVAKEGVKLVGPLVTPGAGAEGGQRYLTVRVSKLDAGVAGGVGAEVVALDGKTVRYSFDSAKGRSATHLVSVWASANRLVLGQIKVHDKSNQITALPECS